MRTQTRALMDYWQDAACIGMDLDMFVTEKSGHKKRLATYYAKQVCKTCPLTQQCKEFAIANNLIGVWGGTTTEERYSLKVGKAILWSQTG